MAVGDTNLYFMRETRVFLKSGPRMWEVPILDGSSLSQSTNSSDISLAEMSDASGKSRRGMKKFNDSLSPAEWQFTSYIRPTIAGGVHTAVEAVLWSQFVAAGNYNPATITASAGSVSGGVVTLTVPTQSPASFAANDTVIVEGATPAAYNGIYKATGATATSISYKPAVAPTGPTTVQPTVRTAGTKSTVDNFEVSFEASNTITIGEFELYYVFGASTQTSRNYVASDATTIMKISGCVVNEASINFDIDGIASIAWSGQGGLLEEVESLDATGAIVTGITNTNNMIRNRLTAIDIVSSVSGSAKTYGITLTGGSITISNNVTFLTPESLGIVNVPLAHVVGGRSASGNFTCYMDEATLGSLDLYADMVGARTTVTNSFNLKFYIGGKSASSLPLAPGMVIEMPRAHLELPSIDLGDVISYDVAFTALGTNISATDEVSVIRYVGV